MRWKKIDLLKFQNLKYISSIFQNWVSYEKEVSINPLQEMRERDYWLAISEPANIYDQLGLYLD